jgi:hypothetical protein
MTKTVLDPFKVTPIAQPRATVAQVEPRASATSGEPKRGSARAR